MDTRAGSRVFVSHRTLVCGAALAAVHPTPEWSGKVNMTELIPLAPLITSLTVIATVIIAAWKVRDLIATRSELQEVKEAVERCARKDDLESLRATMNLHISQATQSIHELRIDLARMDERAMTRWEGVMNKLSEVKNG